MGNEGVAQPQDEGQYFVGTTGNDNIRGTVDDDFFYMAQGGNDRVAGEAGDDTIQMDAAFTANDRIDGGDGNDTLSLNGDYSKALKLKAATLANVEYVQFASGHSYDLVLDAANVAAGGYLVATGQALGAADSLTFDASAVAGDVYLRGGKGNDTLVGGAGNDLFRSNGGMDVIDGGGGHNRISFYTSTSGLTLDLNKEGQAQNTGLGTLTLSHVEDVSGTNYADHITGDDQDNNIGGGGGSDVLIGNGGSDWFFLGVGGDGTLPTKVTVDGGTGEDLVDFSSNDGATAGVTLDLGLTRPQDTGQGSYRLTSIEDASGSGFADHIMGSNGDNHIYGADGNDVLEGGKGNDVLIGDGQIGFSDGNGFDGPRYLAIHSGTGDDILIGGASNDTLTGGEGSDTFYFEKGSNSDVITDFTPGTDKIRINVGKVDGFAELKIADDGAGGALVSWRGGATVDLQGVQPSSLHASDFTFGALSASAPNGHAGEADADVLAQHQHELQIAGLLAHHLIVE